MAKAKEEIGHLISPLEAICKLFDRHSWSGMIVGGIAASILGIPRFTRDIDALIWLNEEDIDIFLEEAKILNIVPRISDITEFAKKNKVFLMKHKETGINIDISLGILAFEKEAISKSKKIKVGKITIPLPTPEDLIILKAVAQRPQDLLDIEGIIKSQKNLNKRYILKYLEEFSHVLDMPEIYQTVKKLLSKRKSL
jgi:hypothetical protein